MVLLKQVHHSLRPVCHVFTDHEGEVTSVHILPVHERLWLESVSDPKSVFHVCDRIVDASENGNWYLRDVFDWNQISVLLGVDKVIEVRGENLESIALHVLGVEHNRLDRRTIWLVSHVDLESLVVI